MKKKNLFCLIFGSLWAGFLSALICEKIEVDWYSADGQIINVSILIILISALLSAVKCLEK